MMPAFTAPPLPRFGFSARAVAPPARATSAVSSCEPSSTTISSDANGWPSKKACHAASVAGSRRASLYAGITTETVTAGWIKVSSADVAVSAKSIEQALSPSIPTLAGVVEPFRVLDSAGYADGYQPDMANDDLVAMYRWMVFGRQLDARGLQLQRQGRIGVWGPMIGQEAAQAGLGQAMRPGDWIFPSYREVIALCMQGMDLVDLFAYYRGLYWPANPAESGVYPIQIVIGDQSLHAVGAGIGFALQHQPRAAVGV